MILIERDPRLSPVSWLFESLSKAAQHIDSIDAGTSLVFHTHSPAVKSSKLGFTVLPGLIDSHTHLTIDGKSQDPLTELEHTAAQRAFGSLPNARAVLLAGFTTVRDLGSYRALVDVALRDAINRGDVVGPRMLVAGAYVTITGGAGSVSGFAPDVTLPWDLAFSGGG